MKINENKIKTLNDKLIIIIISLSLIVNHIGINIMNLIPLDYILYFIGVISILIVNRGKIKFSTSKMTISIIFFTIFINFTVLWSNFKAQSFAYSSRFVFLFLLYLLIINIKSEESIVTIFKFIVILIIIISIFSGINLYLNPHMYYGRFLFYITERGDPNFTAHQLFFCVIALLYLISKNRENILLLLLLFLFSFLFILTQSRGGYLALFASTILMYSKLVKKENKKAINIYLLFSILAFISLIFILILVKPSVFTYNLRINDLTSGSVRLKLWADSLKYIAKNPFFGNGAGSYIYTLQSAHVTHNSYIEILFGGGIIALIAFINIFINALKNIKTSNKDDKLLIYIRWFLLFSLFAMIFLNLETSRLMWLIIGISEILYYQRKGANDESITN